MLSRKTGLTSDDMSEAMVDFIGQVEGVRRLPDSTAIAFDLVMALSEYSYGDLDCDGGGYGERPSDEMVDDLLGELATERRKLEPQWDHRGVLQTLKAQAKHFSDYGIEDFCAGTIKLLSGWQNSSPAAADLN